VVTGGAAGIGTATARALAGAGASVVLAVRRPGDAAAVVADMRRATGCSDISIAPLNLADLRSVRAFADEWHGPLHILVNNAGIMAVPDRQETAQGFELQFGTNFLGHFARLLIPDEASRSVTVRPASGLRNDPRYEALLRKMNLST
jgi:NAD(P)-dependent dehydrogenase (short-subunit alcohol dehydrogenase family)